jgi:Integrase core domain
MPSRSRGAEMSVLSLPGRNSKNLKADCRRMCGFSLSRLAPVESHSLRQRAGTDESHFLAWCVERQIELVHIQPGKPTQNAHVESFHGRLREECLTVSWFQNLSTRGGRSRRGRSSTTRSARTAVWDTARRKSSRRRTSRLQRYNSCRLTSRLLATKPAGSPAPNRCTASSLNSLLNFLRDPIHFPLFAAF